MKKALIPILISLIFCSCLSAPRSGADNQSPLPGESAVADPMAFEPTADALFFRYDLIRGKKEQYVEGTGDSIISDLEYSVFGCDLGNGLAIDANCNVYLDPFKLFGIDPSARFSMKRGQESIQRGEDGYKIRGYRDGVIQLETATVDDRGWTKVKIGPLTVRNLQLDETGKQGACMRGLEKERMSATDREIRVSGPSTGQVGFTRSGNVVEIQGSKKIKVEQREDSYKIIVTDLFFFLPQSNTEYTLYFFENRIIFQKAGRVKLDLTKRPDGLYDTKTGSQVLSVSLE